MHVIPENKVVRARFHVFGAWLDRQKKQKQESNQGFVCATRIHFKALLGDL